MSFKKTKIYRIVIINIPELSLQLPLLPTPPKRGNAQCLLQCHGSCLHCSVLTHCWFKPEHFMQGSLL